MPGFLKPKAGNGDEAATLDAGGARGGRLVERDIEAPEVFQATTRGLWDGRPSLGGVWVAHPEVKEPERVIIRNQENGQFVIGALFKRERETPGPALQVSSDAAAAIGMLAGQPAELNVVALRREEVSAPGESMPIAASDAGTAGLDGAEDVETSALDPVAASAEAALAPAPQTPQADAPEQVAAASPAPETIEVAPRPSGGLDKPYLQIGIFSVEQNAENTAEAMRQAGMVPTVKKQSSSGKTFWRVVVGPAQSASERATLLSTIKDSGFTDAYAVTN
ncbi:SPOR domain-containing protein [Roseivivax jejudonensis]|nr:SPOR domain-containing protein [Roseivivax jejudonensis]